MSIRRTCRSAPTWLRARTTPATWTLAELDKWLTYDPKHPGTLMNVGIIKWQGKKDVNGAIAAWQTLLKPNPNFPQKEVIEHLITQARQQRNTAQSSNKPTG